MVVVGRHIEGVTLNPLEYLLDDNGGVMEFADETAAKAYLKGKGLSDDEICWFAFEPAESKWLKVGSYIPATDDSDAVIEREYYGQGYVFKDEQAYETGLDQVCYVAELSETAYTHQDFLDLCDNQEPLARDLFDRVDWQHPETLLEDDYASGEYDDCPVCGRMFASYDANECSHCHAPYKPE